MKRIVSLACLIILCHSAKSQVLISLLLGDKLNTGKIEFGLDGGWNPATIKGISGANMSSRFNLGFYFDIKMKNPRWMFHTGVIVKSSMGAEGLPVYSLHNANLDTVFTGGKVERKINYFNVPLMMKYKLSNSFFVEGGTMLGLRYTASDVFTQSVEHTNDLSYKVDIADQYHRIDAGVIAGIGYRLMGGNGMNLGIRYYLGLVDMTIDNSTPNQYNQSIYFVVGIPIGAGKAKKVREEEK